MKIINKRIKAMTPVASLGPETKGIALDRGKWGRFFFGSEFLGGGLTG